jgi:putative endonuclease
MYIVYILQCSDTTLYTWITTDIDRRVKQHNWELVGWAKYTRARWPVELVYFENFENRSDATKRECAIKKLPRNQKIDLIDNFEIPSIPLIRGR